MPIAIPSQRLLALLALQDGGPLRRSHVAGTLWSEVTEGAARSNLRSALWKLGQIRDALVGATGDHLRLHPDVTVDVHESRASARCLLDSSVNGAVWSLQDFAADVLPDWTDVWLEPERESYRQVRLHALEELSSRLVALGRFGEAVEAGLIAKAGAPLRESAHRALIRALVMEGNRGEALSHYRRLSDLLRGELGVEPSFRMEDVLIEKAAP